MVVPIYKNPKPDSKHYCPHFQSVELSLRCLGRPVVLLCSFLGVFPLKPSSPKVNLGSGLSNWGWVSGLWLFRKEQRWYSCLCCSPWTLTHRGEKTKLRNCLNPTDPSSTSPERPMISIDPTYERYRPKLGLGSVRIWRGALLNPILYGSEPKDPFFLCIS